MRRTIITRGPSPHPTPDQDTHLYSNTGTYIGRIEYTTRNGATTSVLHYPFDQQPHQPYRLRAKHRPPR